ncbi:Mitochondrial ATP synthase D chain-related protein [Trema orientale]|uniref:Mitochondrial ATP synthase D chain-related protein n=1 Tax=Trema orientale TaxID=63057 RepID=A0A2P5FBD0_TREOI|nr:Mitochondrial ATP synthase D chain-related protein [Trema orientale]
MEDEKKKKRNKKKQKNKQNKTSDGGQSHVSNGQNDESSNVGTDGQDAEVYLNTNGSNGVDTANLEETTRQLQREKDFIQKEAILEETIRQLQTEKDFHIQKETTLEDTISQLRKENNLHLQKEFTFEEVIKQLRDENSTYIRNKASLEMKILQLQREKDSWLQKEGLLEEKISQLVDEKNSWVSKEVSLQEKVKHLDREKLSWVLKEDLTKEIIANVNDDIAGLRAQVVELEESKNNLLQENQQHIENISSLQMQIKDLQNIASTQSSEEFTKLSSEREELNSQIEAACQLVEKLVAENAELVEKVNELFVELDRHGGSSGLPSTVPSEVFLGTTEISSFSHQGSETNEIMPIVGQELNSIEIVAVKEERNGIHNSDYHRTDVITEPSISEVSGEIVQIPLDENEVRDLEIQVAENDENAAVPISDAPLIGAPFRLISFVSRYVSGADLVNKNSLRV